MDKMHLNESYKREIFKTVVVSVILLALFLGIVLLTYRYKENLSIPVIAALAIFGLAMLSVSIWTAMQGGRTTGYFYCGNCSEKFVPSIRSYMSAAHVLRKSYLKCPKCGKKAGVRKRRNDLVFPKCRSIVWKILSIVKNYKPRYN